MILILDNIRSAANVGSIFRTADSLAISEICLCGITAIPPNKEILKSALGATESVKWQYIENIKDAIQTYRLQHFKIVSLEQNQHSIPLEKFVFNANENYAIVVGNEVEGVQSAALDASDFIIEIPQLGIKKSLNVAVATGIVCWEILKQQRLSTQ